MAPLVLSGLNVLFLFTTFKPTAREAFRDRQTALHDDRQRKSAFLEAGGAAPVDGPVKSAAQSGMWFVRGLSVSGPDSFFVW